MSKNTGKRADAWERWDWLWKAIFYTSVLVSTGLMLIDDERTAPIWVTGLLTAALLMWHGIGLRLAYRDGDRWDELAIIRLAIILGDILIWFALVNISPAYYFVLFGLFGQIFRHLPIRFAIPVSALLTAAVMYLQLTGSGEPFSLTNPTVWLFLLIGVSGIVLGVWASSIIGQSSRRRALIEQLESTRAELATAERREGVLEERQRLAREIHDTLAQGFTSIIIHLEAAEQALPNDLETLQKHLERARRTARENLKQARRVVQNLRPEALEGRSLPDAIKRTALRWEDETGINVTTTTTGESVPVRPDIEVTLLRAVQEALNNIRKYAQASEVQLTLSYMDDVVILDVQDNGLGFDRSNPSPTDGGYGLQAMRERAESYGGSLVVESDPGEGTTLVVSIPVHS